MANKKSGDKGKAAESSSKGALKGCQKIKVRHILCERYGRIEEAQARLDAGAKFDDVAREFSEDKARAGGLLGEKTRDQLDDDFAREAFEMEASTTSSPVTKCFKTIHGWHIVMVEARI